MQSLQEEITVDLNKLKQEIEFQVPDFLKQSIQQMKLSSYPVHKKQEMLKALTGSRTYTEENFEGKLAESLLRHLLRIRKNRIQTIPGLNSQKPVYLGQLITLTLFVYEDQLLNEYSVLSDITKQINCKVQEFYEERREQLKLIKIKEQNLLKFMQNQILAPTVKSNDGDSDFSKCLCHQANGLFQQIKGKLATSAIGTCRMCSKSFHGFCLQNNTFPINFICPYCTISHLDPLNKVQEELYKPQFTQLSLLRNEKTIFFDFPQRLQGCRIQIRCLRVDDKGGLDEITWPDYGELYVNQYKYQQFEPCLINSSLKKRRDEYYILNNQLHIDKSNKITLLEGKPTEELRRTHRIKLEGVYMIGVFACNTYMNRELVQEIKQNPRNFISIHEAMKNDNNDSEFQTRKISLLCQVSMQLMKIPAKGRYCAHMQCFDLENYILMMSQQSSRGKWRCVICKLKCYNFLIDSYQQIILDTIHDHNISIQDVEFENGLIKDQMLRELCASKLPNSQFDIIEIETRKKVKYNQQQIQQL